MKTSLKEEKIEEELKESVRIFPLFVRFKMTKIKKEEYAYLLTKNQLYLFAIAWSIFGGLVLNILFL